MFSILPDLTPRDSHSLWYISSRNPNLTPSHLDPNFLYSSNENGSPLQPPGGASAGGGGGGPTANTRHNTTHTHNQNQNNRSAAAQAAIIDRSVLGRLLADEVYMERRRANVANLGSTWLKPPGVPKTLFQMREERREAEEHAEAMRREMLQQELAEAEAANAAAAAAAAGGLGEDDLMEGADGVVGGDGMMMDDEEENGEGGRDLDDDIPDADEGGFGFDGTSDDEEESEEESEESEVVSDELEDVEDDADGLDDSPRRQRRELANRIGNMRATEDAMRERLATRHIPGRAPEGGDLYGADEDFDEEDQADILEEDDLVQGGYDDDLGPGMEEDLDMDANLDDEIPEAESLGGYEHTDSEAELSDLDDDEDEEQDMSYALPGPSGGSARRRLPQQHHHNQQFGRNSAHRISSSGPYALPPYTQQRQQQQQQEGLYRLQHRENRSSLTGSHRGGEGVGGYERGGASRQPRSSLDISGLLSQDGSSVYGSSPRMN